MVWKFTVGTSYVNASFIKLWPFRGWRLDFIGQINPPSSKGHRFMLVATDYFTKWTEAVPLKNMTHREVIEFITEHIIHRFDIPQTLTMDQGSSFISKEVHMFIESYKIKLLNSSPYYAQANGQAESSNKILIKLIKKKIEENPKRWHEVLSEALWAHHISRHGATKVIPFELVYGQEAILPVEVNLDAYRLAKQNDLSAVDYYNSMMDNIDEVTDKRIKTLKEIERDKLRVARAYNKKHRGPLDLWNEWATKFLVLLSLTLQVVPLLLAGICCREASPTPKFILWLAYQLSDSTSIYTLVAFWAPFLLLHLGGSDNITAYALEDSKLWLRHLQNLILHQRISVRASGDGLPCRADAGSSTAGGWTPVHGRPAIVAAKLALIGWGRCEAKGIRLEVLGAAYVLYKYVDGGDSFIFLAAILMFSVGVVKYAERTWALKRSNLNSIRSSLKKEHVGLFHHFHPSDFGSMVNAVEDDESYVLRAHSMFHICNVDKDPAENQSSWEEKKDLRNQNEDHEGMWTLMEMELSLTYDLLYTKAGVIHTWSGYGIHVASSLTAAASILLFWFSSKDGHSPVDVAISYTLLAGALLFETGSLLRVVESSWTYAFLCNTRWNWLQHYYSGSVQLSEDLKYQLLEYTKCLARRGLNMQGVITMDRGQCAFYVHQEMGLYKSIEQENDIGVEFQEGIIIWHIATELQKFSSPKAEDMTTPRMQETCMLYRQITRDNLTEMWDHSREHQKGAVFAKLKAFFSLHDDPNSAGSQHVENLAKFLFTEKPKPTLDLLDRMEKKGRTAMLQLLLDVWMDFLVYGANRCSRESHAKKLSNGGELTMILWIMTERR
ncbi:hypothetical protein PVAP13_7NG025367 [Panicum virgatum]|uniref:Integrase catalytic domain-containing protein n=1 Tax=Panicum virgatum TaxID=38727 RepID=A0A8T0Q1E4_PANVG|nr:hypothetical protein PVAP13_7NG025367 [Panicum virgatum]